MKSVVSLPRFSQTIVLAATLSFGNTAEPRGPESLPRWYRENRIQLHWEGDLSVAQRAGNAESLEPWLRRVHGNIAAMGAEVTVGLAKRGAEGAWWPSAVGESHLLARDRDLFAEYFVGSAREQGLRYIAYYRHDIDLAAQAAHPDWRALDPEGTPYASYRHEGAMRLSFHSPYRDFVRQRLVETVERGAVGIYFDADHMFPVDASPSGRAAYARFTDRPFPGTVPPFSSDFVTAANVTAAGVTDSFRAWRDAVRTVNPETVFIAGAEPLSEFSGLHHGENLADAVDSLKIEFQKHFGGQRHWPEAPLRRMVRAHSDFWIPDRSLGESIAWQIARDLAYGRPAHVWNYKPAPKRDETLWTNLAIVAHGNIASAYADVMSDSPAYEELFALNRALGPVMADMRPYGEVAVHVGRALLEQAWVASDEQTSYVQRYQTLYAPVFLTVETLRREGIPYVFTFDSHLRQGELPSEVRVVVVPRAEQLPAALKAALARQREQGRALLPLAPGAGWHLTERKTDLMNALATKLRDLNGEPRIRVTPHPDVVVNHFIHDRTGDLLITRVRDWNTLWHFGDARGNRAVDLPPLEPLPPADLQFQETGATLRLLDDRPNNEWQTQATPDKAPPCQWFQFLIVESSTIHP